MKRVVSIIIIFLIFPLISQISAESKVKLDPKNKTLELTEVYILNKPSLCFHTLMYIQYVPNFPYGIGLKVSPMGEGTYDINGTCDTSEDVPYLDGVSNNLIIPEFNINGKTYVINLHFDYNYGGFYIVSIKEKSTVNYNNQELIGYCGVEENGGNIGCSEYYYIEGNSDRESVINTIEQTCKYQNSQLVRGEYCPIHNDFTYACKVKILNSAAQITYYKDTSIDLNIIEKMKDACEMYNGEFIKGNY